MSIREGKTVKLLDSIQKCCYGFLMISEGNKNVYLNSFNPFQTSISFHIETSHLICTVNQMFGFYMELTLG